MLKNIDKVTKIMLLWELWRNMQIFQLFYMRSGPCYWTLLKLSPFNFYAWKPIGRHKHHVSRSIRWQSMAKKGKKIGRFFLEKKLLEQNFQKTKKTQFQKTSSEVFWLKKKSLSLPTELFLYNIICTNRHTQNHWSGFCVLAVIDIFKITRLVLQNVTSSHIMYFHFLSLITLVNKMYRPAGPRDATKLF